MQQINGTLCCVHGSVLKKHSPYFAETFLVPGITTPIVLDDIATAAEFDMFLSILYPRSVLHLTSEPIHCLTI